MSYPERPTCHDEDFQSERFGKASYEVRNADGAYGVNAKHCSYCGSLSPEALVLILSNKGVSLELSDQKYGWPHKFYVSGIPNPLAGQTVKMGSKSWTDEVTGKRKHEDTMSPAPLTLTCKFYNVHLLDVKGTPEFDIVSDLIFEKSGIRFFIQDDKLYVKRA